MLEKLLSPNCPTKFQPQVHKVPSVFIAAVEFVPHATLLQVVPPEKVCTGELLFTTVLSPSCPWKLLPHNHKVPSVFIAAAWFADNDITLQLLPADKVCTGEFVLIILLLPSWPI